MLADEANSDIRFALDAVTRRILIALNPNSTFWVIIQKRIYEIFHAPMSSPWLPAQSYVTDVGNKPVWAQIPSNRIMTHGFRRWTGSEMKYVDTSPYQTIL